MNQYQTADELIAKHGSAVDAVLAINLGALTVGTLMVLFARMAKEVAAQAKAPAISDEGSKSSDSA